MEKLVQIPNGDGSFILMEDRKQGFSIQLLLRVPGICIKKIKEFFTFQPAPHQLSAFLLNSVQLLHPPKMI